MIKTTCKKAGMPKACLKKVLELWYIPHPKGAKALLGPFLIEADAECGRVVMHSTDTMVTAYLVDSIDDFTCWHGVNNGQVCRAFAGAAKGVA